MLEFINLRKNNCYMEICISTEKKYSACLERLKDKLI